jgi:hypothetical protein
MTVRYPVPGLTSHGLYHLIEGRIPMMWLESHDGTVVFDLMGGRTIVDRRAPEVVQIARDGIKGLIPPWRTVDQKGASQDGITWVDSLYDPAEVTLTVDITGRDHIWLRKVVRDLIASLDTRKTAKLHFWTHQAGHWWTDLRWFKTPPDTNRLGAHRKHRMTLVTRADNAFWRTDPSVDMWQPAYDAVSDTFDYLAGSASATSLGANWPLHYLESGDGYIYADGSKARWADEAGLFTADRTVIAGPYKDFATLRDQQAVAMKLGSVAEYAFPHGGYNDIWVRMGRNVNGTWNGYGVRMRIGSGGMVLSRFNNFIETEMARQLMWWPQKSGGEEWLLAAGTDADPRVFTLYRGGMEVMTHKEKGTGSALGSAYRGIGFGMGAAGAILWQATPATVKRVAAADNIVSVQEGYLRLVNVGDQPMYPTFTVFGPGSFTFWVNDTDTVTFGPLLPNQVVRIDTDPRNRSVQDLTSRPPTPQEQQQWQKVLDELLTFGTNSPQLAQQIKSQWGILPPQGNLYSLLKGRWSTDSAIPPKPAGESARPVFLKVQVTNGMASTKVIASGTPLRRYPL